MKSCKNKSQALHFQYLKKWLSNEILLNVCVIICTWHRLTRKDFATQEPLLKGFESSADINLRSKRFRVLSEEITRNESKTTRKMAREKELGGSRSIFRAAKTGNPVPPRSFVAPKPNGSAYYAGYVDTF